MAAWPERGQNAPDFWDVVLKDYIDSGDAAATAAAEAAVTPETVMDALGEEPAATALSNLIDDTAAANSTNTATDLGAALAGAFYPLSANLGTYLAARLALSATGPVRIAALGSSTTAGTGATSPSRRYVDTLARTLQAIYPSGVTLWEPPTLLLDNVVYAMNLPGIHMVNGGIGGSWSNSYVPAGTLTKLTTLQPHVVLHMPLSNDYRTGLFTPAQTQANIIANMAAIDGVLTQPAVHIICGTFAAPDTLTPAYPWSAYLAAGKAAAASHANALWIDPSAAFVAATASGPGAVDPLDLITSDNVHATDRGHALLAREIARLLNLPRPTTPVLPEAYDRFARTTLGNTETSQPWTEQSTAVHVPNGRYLTVTTAGNAVIQTGISDVEVSAVCVISTGAVSGVIAKSTDPNTRVGWYYNGPNDRMEIYLGTVLKNFSAALGLVNGREYLFTLWVKNDTIVGYVDGQQVLTATLTSGEAATYAAYTQHGVRANSVTGTPMWRNFSVRPL